jgi:hypothetical protein
MPRAPLAVTNHEHAGSKARKKRDMISVQVPDDLATATRSYLRAFGHPVPDEIVEMFASRPGPLLLEIRQAVALGRPVKAWLARSRIVPGSATGLDRL